MRGRGSARATVLADDYVQGRLPRRCVATGRSTRSRLADRTTIDGPSSAWFLALLLGPVGWIMLAFVLLTARRSVLAGEYPLADAVWASVRQRRRRAFVPAALGLVLLLLAALADFAVGVSLVILLVTLVACLALYWRATAVLPRIELDATRRWVTLHGVHPDFAAAAAAVRAFDSH